MLLSTFCAAAERDYPVATGEKLRRIPGRLYVVLLENSVPELHRDLTGSEKSRGYQAGEAL